MISVEQAVELANDFCFNVFHQTGLIEEVELEDSYWLITLSIKESEKKENEEKINSAINFWGLQKIQKNYKQFKVDGDTGKVLSAKIRQLN